MASASSTSVVLMSNHSACLPHTCLQPCLRKVTDEAEGASAKTLDPPSGGSPTACAAQADQATDRHRRFVQTTWPLTRACRTTRTLAAPHCPQAKATTSTRTSTTCLRRRHRFSRGSKSSRRRPTTSSTSTQRRSAPTCRRRRCKRACTSPRLRL